MSQLDFNPKPSTIMHIDLNSCFATIEQQANPHLRGKPIAVAAYTTASGCILAPSVEAKRYGIKTGMRVKDGKLLYPNLIVLPSDPWKYRNVHLALRRLLGDYTNELVPKSIDEFVLNLKDYLDLKTRTVARDFGRTDDGSKANNNSQIVSKIMLRVGREIKERIRKEIGEWLTVSVGIAPNRFLAKLASSLNKPDGLDEINKDNYLEIYSHLELTDLCGIKIQNAARLNSVGIFTVLDFCQVGLGRLKAAFKSINAYYWYVRLRGWEIDDVEFARRSYGNSYVLPKPLVTPEELSPILTKLVEKMGTRLRRAGYKARGVRIAVTYRDWSHWHKGVTYPKVFFDSRDIYKEAFKILSRSPYKKPVRELAISCFGLLKSGVTQLGLFEDVEKKERVVRAVDDINKYWGDFVIAPARILLAESDSVPDRIAFGAAGSDEPLARRGVKELEEFTLGDTNIRMDTNN